MEDLKAYIESGVLELYVLGDLPENERSDVERMLEMHPELRTELAEIEKALELFADKNAIEPPQDLKATILSKLESAEENTAEQSVEQKVIPISEKNNRNVYKYAFAASVALLLLSLFAIINLYSQLEESRNRITSLEESNQQFSQRVNVVEDELQVAKQSLEVFHNPQKYKLVSLKGTPKAPSASMIIAFSPETEEVMIDMASLKMPSNDKAHQYQLWALVDGKPVDLGVFEMKSDTLGMLKMKAIKNAQAFAVTLEPRGGSINPTLEQMMLMGAI